MYGEEGDCWKSTTLEEVLKCVLVDFIVNVYFLGDDRLVLS